MKVARCFSTTPYKEIRMAKDKVFIDLEDNGTVEVSPQLVDLTAHMVSRQLVAFAEQTGRSLGNDAKVIGAYAAQRAAVLATLVDQPGFEDAVLAERDNVVIKAGIAATKRGDAIDQRLIGIIQGTLRTAAVMLIA